MKKNSEDKCWLCPNCKQGADTSSEKLAAMSIGQDSNISLDAQMKEIERRILSSINDHIVEPLISKINKLSEENNVLIAKVNNFTAIMNSLKNCKCYRAENEKPKKVYKHRQKTKSPKKFTNTEKHADVQSEVVEPELNKQTKKTIADKNLENGKYSKSLSDSSSNKQNESKTIIGGSLEEDNNGFKVVTKKKRPMNSHLVMGTAKDSSLKGALQYNNFHIRGLDPQTSEFDVKDFLSKNRFLHAKCEKRFNRNIPTVILLTGVKINTYYFRKLLTNVATT
ncbi:hypothetical protein QE152_g6862 [Popillia japonica]|uniref:Uncharacterized protein n=1 Tax=Popillia japonica TaxID=7064 RepID=A0AAW1MFR0_POPJA